MAVVGTDEASILQLYLNPCGHIVIRDIKDGDDSMNFVVVQPFDVDELVQALEAFRDEYYTTPTREALPPESPDSGAPLSPAP